MFNTCFAHSLDVYASGGTFVFTVIDMEEIRMQSKFSLGLVLPAVVLSSAFTAATTAQDPMVDGLLDATYPTEPDAVQTTNTMFADNTDPDPLIANGSELDVLHVYTTETDLYLFLGGNLESNFNKLNVFIDAVSGGQNTVRFDNPNVDFDGLNRMGGNEFVGGALILDEGFEADFYLTFGLGNDPVTMYASAAQMLSDGGGVGIFLGSSTDNPNGKGGILSDTGIEITIDNSNVGGVIGGEDGGDGSGVTTGIEIKIPFGAFPDLYTQGSGMKVCAFISSSDHGFASNQFLSGLGASNNLGEVRLVDLTLVDGCQFVAVDGDPGGYPCNPGGGGGDPPGDPAVVMDGSKDSEYGAAVAVQDTMTGFGDASIGLPDFCDGSEIDAIYGFIDEERLNLLIAGNLESNNNHVEVFLDFGPGGQNTIRGDNPGVNFGALQRMGDDGKAPGLTFDEGFEADVYLEVNCGGDKAFNFYGSAAQMLTDGGGTGLEFGAAGTGEVLSNFNGMQVAINNSNIAGVVGGVDLDDGSGVETGIEISIPLARLVGYESGDIKVCAFINASDHGYLSNQVIGGIGGGDNLMEPRFVDFSAIAGDQFVVITTGGDPSCPGDLDNNGDIGGADLTLLLGSWGETGSIADLDGNGTVGGADLTILLGSWGPCS